MEEKNEVEKVDDVILPGFRFHPTDEELVGFYLKRKISHQTLPIELIKQVDIYKYDPWDLPKLAGTGEKEWYFYCPRDRKYRNSTRPNRVTGAGFWKATGTDRPIYSSDGAKCIGLKKSLVFYRGRAAKGIKTDWMMHEFRLPSLLDAAPPKKLFDRSLPINDSWAICRIFKKTNSMAQRSHSHTWVSPLPETTTLYDIFNQTSNIISSSHFNPQNTQPSIMHHQIYSNNDFLPYKPVPNPTVSKPSVNPSSLTDVSPNLIFSAGEFAKVTDNVHFSGSQTNQQFSEFPISVAQNAQQSEAQLELTKAQIQQWNSLKSVGFPFDLRNNNSLITNSGTLSWESASELSTSYSSDKRYR